MSRSFCQLCGTSMFLAVGASRPERTIASNTASSAAVSELPAGISGLMSSEWWPKAVAAAPKAEALVAVAAKATVAGGQAELAILLVVGVAMLLLVVAAEKSKPLL